MTNADSKEECKHPESRVLDHQAVVLCKEPFCGNEVIVPHQTGQECLDCGAKTCKCEHTSKPDRKKVVTHIYPDGICEEHGDDDYF